MGWVLICNRTNEQCRWSPCFISSSMEVRPRPIGESSDSLIRLPRWAQTAIRLRERRGRAVGFAVGETGEAGGASALNFSLSVDVHGAIAIGPYFPLNNRRGSSYSEKRIG